MTGTPHDVVSAPEPWRLYHAAVGGLWAVGFGPASDLLLVLSVNGLGVFDCLTGQRVARAVDEVDYDDVSETVTGIGPLAGGRIELSGRGTGAIVTRRVLPLVSRDGWRVAVAEPAGRAEIGVLLHAPSPVAITTTVANVEEVRALGFSPTGRSFVVAEPHTLHIWSR
jgi:hypothetical protein